MTLDEAIGQYMAYVDAEKMGITSFTITTREAEQLAEWLKELKFYKDRQDLINKSWQELISYKEGIVKIKIRSQVYRECGESILASGMEQALDILEEVNTDDNI